MSAHKFVALLLSVVCTVAASPVAAGEKSDRTTLTKIWDAWNQRQSAADTVRVRWTFKGFVSSPVQQGEPAAGSNAAKRTAEPARVTMPESECSLALAGGRVRYESRIPSFVGKDHGSTIASVSAFDGTVQQYLSDRAGHSESQNHGSVAGKSEFDEWQSIHLLPLVCVLRPLRSEAFGSDPQRWRVKPGDRTVAGRACVLISGRDPSLPPETASVIDAYLDPQRDFVPLRIVYRISGKLSATLEMAYDKPVAGIWVPRSWKSTMYSPAGDVREGSQNRLLTFAAAVSIDDDEFRIKFPPGTVVVDKRKNEQAFIVQPDGSMIALNEATRETPGRSWLFWCVVVSTVFLCGAFILWWIVRKKGGHRRTPVG